MKKLADQISHYSKCRHLIITVIFSLIITNPCSAIIAVAMAMAIACSTLLMSCCEISGTSLITGLFTVQKQFEKV